MAMIYLDNIIFSLQKSGGISVVWYELLNRYIQKPLIDYQCIEYSEYLNIFRRKIILPFDKVRILSSRFLFLKRYFDVSINCSNKFIFHSSYYRLCNSKNAINITTVHDFTYEYFFSGIKKYLHSWQKRRAIMHSDYVICISENTKKDLLKFCPKVDPSKLYVIYNGVSDDYHPILNKAEIQFDIPDSSYVLFVGNRVSYKNFNLVINSLIGTPYSLVIVGKSLSKSENDFVYSKLSSDRVFVYSNINNEQLNILYNHAFCLLYPSSYEGFGIPVLEAQKAGCPVIAYNASSIPEIIGDKTLLLNNLCVEEIHDMFHLLENKEMRKRIIDFGLKNAKKYTWDNMYNQVINLYKKALCL